MSNNKNQQTVIIRENALIGWQLTFIYLERFKITKPCLNGLFTNPTKCKFGRIKLAEFVLN